MAGVIVALAIKQLPVVFYSVVMYAAIQAAVHFLISQTADKDANNDTNEDNAGAPKKTQQVGPAGLQRLPPPALNLPPPPGAGWRGEGRCSRIWSHL